MGSVNVEGKPCLGDLVEEGLVTKKLIPDGDRMDSVWTNVSDKTFPVEMNKCINGKCFLVIQEFKPGDTI